MKLTTLQWDALKAGATVPQRRRSVRSARPTSITRVGSLLVTSAAASAVTFFVVRGLPSRQEMEVAEPRSSVGAEWDIARIAGDHESPTTRRNRRRPAPPPVRQSLRRPPARPALRISELPRSQPGETPSLWSAVKGRR